jgi:hypothetical protein
MKKNLSTIFVSVLVMLTVTSCNGWFDVTSNSEIREKDHYSSVTGFQQSLIGCYIGMTDDALYGKELTWYGLERIANQFEPVTNTSTTAVDYLLQNCNYTNTNTVSIVENIWSKAYNVIVNADEALKYIDSDSTKLDEINYHIIKGELLAVRAYMHFDLLRLYGYGNWGNRKSELDTKYTIPYVTTLSKTATQQLSGKETIQLILADLKDAAALLKDYDPIMGKHDASYYTDVNSAGFLNDRSLRLNYYAVKALQARVYLWEGSSESKTQALNAAEEVIAAVQGNGIANKDMYTYCKLMSASAFNKSNASLLSEYLFGLNVSELYTKTPSYINPTYLDTDVAAMFLMPTDATDLYESSSSDVRFSVLLSQSVNSSSMGYVPVKFYQSNLASGYTNKVPLIRVPEVYYIAAECCATGASPDLQKAMDLLNTVRESRGIYTKLENLTASQIVTEIGKEYHKEFLSEGVMFYYYKRTGATSIPHYSGEMGDKQYVLPYPAFELQSGRVQ